MSLGRPRPAAGFRRLRALVFALGQGWAGMAAAAAAAEEARPAPIWFGVVDVAPWSLWRDGTVSGISTEIFQLIAKRLNRRAVVEIYPPARLKHNLSVGLVDAAMMTAAFASAGEDLGYMMDLRSFAWTTADQAAPDPSSVLAGSVVAFVRGVPRPTPDGIKVRELYPVGTTGEGLAMLLAGRVDCFVGSEWSVRWAIASTGGKLAGIRPAFLLTAEPIRLWLSRNTVNSGIDKAALRDLLAELVATGQIEDIARTYGEPPPTAAPDPKR